MGAAMSGSKLTPVKSSNIRAVDYDASKRVMTVEFKDFVRWRYEDCPPVHAEGIVTAESPGKYFATYIKGLRAEKVPDIVDILKAGKLTQENCEDAAAQIEQLRREVGVRWSP